MESKIIEVLWKVLVGSQYLLSLWWAFLIKVKAVSYKYVMLTSVVEEYRVNGIH